MSSSLDHLGTRPATVEGTRMMFTAACAAAIREEMERDERVFIMGEDIEEAMLGRTSGLLEQFGPKRVRDTPISEAAFLGAGTGAAATGMVPIVDLFMSNFLYVAADQLLNNANKLRYMMGGRSAADDDPGQHRAPGAIGAQHSDAPYAQIINGGGVKVVVPTNPADSRACSSRRSATPTRCSCCCRCRSAPCPDEVPQRRAPDPAGKASVVRDGADVTIVAIGAMVRRAVAAATELERDGHLRRGDRPADAASARRRPARSSVAKTGRLVVVDEARRSCSMASEIVARVVDRA